jgi:triacylglycerol lipase
VKLVTRAIDVVLVASVWVATVGCSSSTAGFVETKPDLGDTSPPKTDHPTGTTDLGGERVPYPIVLCHGLDGFENIGPIDYFYGVKAALTAAGHRVYTPTVDPYNTSDVRGAQLRQQVEAILDETKANKAILVCHSQGGLDCRYVANQMGDRIASVTTISTPHRGTPIADIAMGKIPGPVQKALEAFLNALGLTIQAVDGNSSTAQNARGALSLMTADGTADFTRRFPDDPRVRYFSIAGRSNGARGDYSCATPTEAPFVGRWNTYVDPINPLLSLTGTILNNDLSPPPANDGLVPVGSAKWGTFLGCIPADHLDEMCQIAGQSPGSGNPFDCHTFYTQLADYLVAHSP